MAERRFTCINYGLYKHYKGSVYRVIGIAAHTENPQRLVIYHKANETNNKILWARPEGMFLDDVLVNGALVPRFKKLESCQKKKTKK